MKKDKKEKKIVESENIVNDDTNTQVVEVKKKSSGFKNSGFWLKIFAAAVMLAIGLWMVFDRNTSRQIVITASGAAVGVLCIARLIYLFRDKKSTKVFKIITLVELIINLIISIFLLIAGIKYQQDNESGSKFIEFVENYYRYFLGVVFYLRGVLHFFQTTFFEDKIQEKTSLQKIGFFLNVGFLTLGTFCFAYDFSVGNLAWVMCGLVLLASLYLGVDGIVQFQKFKSGNGSGEKSKKVQKEKPVEKEKEEEKPVVDEPQANIPAAIIEPEKHDQSIVS